MAPAPTHIPVMADEVIRLLKPSLEGETPILLDATLGLGGHTQLFLTTFASLRVIGIDRDKEAIAIASQRLSEFGERLVTYQGTYDHIPEALAKAGVDQVDAVLFDLGLSSLQIDSAERGFAYAKDAPLNMRMDGDDEELTAADVVNTYSEQDLTRILKDYSDERFAARIARAIVTERVKEPFTTSARLVEVISSAIPRAAHISGHPAKKTFQSLRMEVNQERQSLRDGLPQALDALRPGGRMVVLSYHSGEDRLVKKEFAEAAQDKVPQGIAIVPDALKAKFRLLTRGAELPCDEELAHNPRSQSARLRGIERLEEAS